MLKKIIKIIFLKFNVRDLEKVKNYPKHIFIKI